MTYLEDHTEAYQNIVTCIDLKKDHSKHYNIWREKRKYVKLTFQSICKVEWEKIKLEVKNEVLEDEFELYKLYKQNYEKFYSNEYDYN